MADPSTVTIVMPAYNAAGDLARHLPALRREAEGDELIVVDDGSTDATAEVAERFGARVIRQANAGPAVARNVGAAAARGDLLVFLDADCEVSEGWRAALLEPLSDPGVEAVKAAYLTRQRAWVARLCQVEFEERYALLAEHDSIDMVDSFSMAVRRSTFVEAGGFDESFRFADNEDVDLSYRLASRGHRMLFAPAARVLHRHPDTLARYFRLKLSRGYHRMRVYERYPAKAVRDSYTPLSLKLQVLALPVALAAGSGAGLASLLERPEGARLAALACASSLALFGTTTLPFVTRAHRSGPRLGFLAFPFLAVRALAIGAGVAARTVRLSPRAPKARDAVTEPQL